MVLLLILRMEINLDIILRMVDHIEQLVQERQERQERQMTTSHPGSESTVAGERRRLPRHDPPHPILRGDKLGADPARLAHDTHYAFIEVITRDAGVTNDNPFWFSLETDPPHFLHICPFVPNPLFGKKGRAAEYQSLYIF